MLSLDDRDVAASSLRREYETLGGEGVDRGADDCAVVREEVEGIRRPGLPGVAEKLANEPKDNS
jgi:hypothetical protein